MRFNYYVKVAPPDSDVTDFINDFVRLSYTQRLNEVGYGTIALPRDHLLANTITLDSTIYISRGQTHDAVNAAYYQDFAGLYRGNVETTASDGRQLVTLHFPDVLSLVAREIIAFRAGVANRSDWTSKTIAQIWQDILVYNFSLADVNRLLPFTNVSGERRVYNDALTASTTINYSAAYKNVLTALQELAVLGNFHFKGRGGTILGGSLGRFQGTTVEIDPGTDRSATVVFDLGRANIGAVELDKRRVYEPTKIIVGGQGEGASRTVQVRTGSEYTTINHSEVFVDARDLATTAALDARGDTKAAVVAYKPRFTFRATQAPGSYYGRDYFLGDLVAARYKGTMFTQRIVGVTVAVDEDGRESIELDLDNA